MKNFKNKNILILGYARSGLAASKLLLGEGANVFVFDDALSVHVVNSASKKSKNFASCKLPILKLNKTKLKNLNIKANKNIKSINTLTGNILLDKNLNTTKNEKKITNLLDKRVQFLNNLDNIEKLNINLCVISPAISLINHNVKKLKTLGISIISELELGAAFCKGKIFAITGTNGKTTTVNILADIFHNAGKQTFLCGNVGIPICEIAKQTTHKSFIVCEVSSFQLETTKHFAPFATAFLNLQPDHLDRHKNMQKYGFIKNKINKFYKSKKIFNADDKSCVELATNFPNAIFFSLNAKTNGAYFNEATKKLCHKNQEIMCIDKIKLLGKQNLSNILAAINLAKLASIKNLCIKNAVNNFSPLHHRLEIIKTYNEIVFINDSKATNVESTIFALNAVADFSENDTKNIILLLGGSDKNLNFYPIFKYKVKTIIAFGETLSKICKASTDTKYENLKTAKNFNDACNQAFKIAKKGDIVLLSPACASFDEFSSYEHRGERFKQNIFNLIEKNLKIKENKNKNKNN